MAEGSPSFHWGLSDAYVAASVFRLMFLLKVSEITDNRREKEDQVQIHFDGLSLL